MMRCTKGQIFTLDFVISMILVILAFGLVLNFMELNQYNLHEQEIREELKTVGDGAAETLVTSPALVCELGYYTGSLWNRISYPPNCIMPPPAGRDMEIKTVMGLSVGRNRYGCKVEFIPENTATVRGQINTDCKESIPPDADTYSAKRRVIVPNVAVSWANLTTIKRLDKSKFMDTSLHDAYYVTITVWRNE
ncbi:MAG: hypothetical protein V1676_01540 [Candidatus Diapherotrites archaeon]